jgi:glycosyltransferase involved in cell wall biosynthesis
MNPVLSVVIPTKNRYDTLKNVAQTLLKWTSKEFELIIQDNSDDNTDFIEFLSNYKSDSRLIYKHTNHNLSVNENCDAAIDLASGEYVCLIGDDDGLIEETIKACQWMKSNDIDSANCNIAIYEWPNLITKYYGDKFTGELRYANFNSTTTQINPQEELITILKNGAQYIKQGARLYQGIISRKSLLKLKEKTGTYFPGPVPDMSSAVGIVPFIKNHVYFDYPLIIAGSSAKSTAGMGAKKKHHGELNDIAFLLKGTADNWSIQLPKYWSAQTIWAEGALKALQNTGNKDLIEKHYNFNRLFALCLMYIPDYRSRTLNHIKFLKKEEILHISYLTIAYNFILISFTRLKSLIQSVFKLIGINITKIKIVKLDTVGDAILHLQNISTKEKLRLPSIRVF